MFKFTRSGALVLVLAILMLSMFTASRSYKVMAAVVNLIDLQRQTTNANFRSFAYFIIPNGSSLPGTCTQGQLFLSTTTTALYFCATTNSWASLYKDTYIDIRDFGAVGLISTATTVVGSATYGGCHYSSIDDSTSINAALSSSATYGPPDVYAPVGYCWPIGYHVWVPPLVRFHSDGRTSGYEVSSETGGLLIANINWSTNNSSFPYNAMVWVTGSNQSSGTYLVQGETFGSVVDHLEINCSDQVGCSNMFLVGRQEKSRLSDLVLTGGVQPSTGYSYGIYEEGVDCNNNVGTAGPSTPPGWGCLFSAPAGYDGNPFSGQQGPDERLEIFPSYNVASNPRFVLWSLMGGANYKGLLNSTLNGNGSGVIYAGYVWGNNITIGPGVHVEGTASAASPFSGFVNGLYIGNVPAGSSCNGGTGMLFFGLDQPVTIANCGAQQQLTFLNGVGVVNNQNSTTSTTTDYYFSENSPGAGQPSAYGWPGADANTYTPATLSIVDPGDLEFTGGHNGINMWNGNPHSGVNMQVLSDTGNIFMRGSLCSNAFWNTKTQLWQDGYNGGGDIECFLLGNGWNGIATYQGTVGTTFSQSTMNNNVAIATDTAGHTFFGKSIIDNTSGNINVSSDGNIVQVQGGISVGSSTARTSWNNGSGAPSATCPSTSTPYGSLYSNTSSGQLYVCQSGGWSGK